ncbi:MAG: toxic anion resistance protein [Erysipelotrichaceae bacterium]|nr:toxic anion resistance protein [Bacillota bacterium]MDY3092693.1 toxic anion resistance protein [Erysipelotrichaceae bacterium]
MAEQEKITLTLDNKVEEEVKEEVKEEIPESELVSVEDTKLSEEERKMVEEFAQKIDVMETNTILQYGSAAQTKVADFSETALKNVKTKDLGDIGDMMTELIGELKGFEIEEKESGIMSFFKKGANKVTNMKARYDKAADNVDRISKVLEDHQVTLMKDIALLDQLYEKNLTNFKELTMYIMAGKKKLEDVKNNDLPKLRAEAARTGLPEDAQAANDLENAIIRFEKKIHDLELTRVIAIQTAPQIRLVQNNDTMMVEKIQSTLVNTIPLWKSQMVIAMGIGHSHEAIKAQNEVTEMTNKLLKQNAEMLKTATVETAKATERGIVDLETLKNTNAKLIETLDEVKRIQEEGRAKRAEAQIELRRIETELNQKLSGVEESLKH